jgi:hypothetical protein
VVDFKFIPPIDYKFPTPDDEVVSVDDFTGECRRIHKAIKEGSRCIRIHSDIAESMAKLLRESEWSVAVAGQGTEVELILKRSFPPKKPSSRAS